MSAVSTGTKTASETVNLLQFRLQRIEHYLTGSDNGQEQLQKVAAQGRDHAVFARLAKAEHGLARLASESPLVHDLLSLYATYPDLFAPLNPDDVPTTLTTPELVAMISSYATSFPTTASRLTSIKDLPIPSAESSASLIELKSRIARMELLQESQGRELEELRLRSASAIQRWYELCVLGVSDCWTEWESRMSNVEKHVRREEGCSTREAKATQIYNK